MINQLSTLLGFAQKSGNLVAGNEIVLQRIDQNKVKLVFVGTDASDASLKKIILRCERLNIPCYRILTVETMSYSIGKHNRTVIGITDSGFANRMVEVISDMNS